LTNTSTTNVAKRQRFRRKKSSSDVEYPEVTSNMVGSTNALKKPGREQSSQSSEESNSERFQRLKGLFEESGGVYKHTRTRTGTIAPVNYRTLSGEDTLDDECSAIAESQSSSSEVASHAFAHMAGTPEEITRKFEELALFQKQQHEMLQMQ